MALQPQRWHDFADDVIAVLDAEKTVQAVWVRLLIGGVDVAALTRQRSRASCPCR